MNAKVISILALSAFLIGNVAQGDSVCRQKAIQAERQGKTQLVVSFEGLAGYLLGAPVKNYVVKRALDNGLGTDFVPMDYSWTDTSQAYQCILDWHRVLGSKMKLVVLGHSFGGPYGVMELLNELKQAGIEVDGVITMDPRGASNDFNYMASGDRFQFQKPSNVKTFLNFWQTGGGLTGYEVRGAQNFQIHGKTHVNLPSAEPIYKAFVKMVSGNTVDRSDLHPIAGGVR